MSTCSEVGPLLQARLTDSLATEASARLEEHLAACPACRAEAISQDEVLALARLPEPSADDQRALEGLPLLTWRALERGRVRRLSMWGGFGLAAAAALAFVVAAPRWAAPSGHGLSSPGVAAQSPLSAEGSGIEAVADAADDDTLDLEDFAALDVMPGTAAGTPVSADDDDDEVLFQGDEL